MKTIFFLCACLLSWPGCLPAQTFHWVKAGLNGTSSNGINGSAAAAVAQANGRVAAAGYFNSSVTFDTQALGSLSGFANGFAGSWAAVAGAANWVEPALSTGYVVGTAVGIDGAGNTYACYTMNQNAVFGTTLVQTTAYDAVVVLVKYSPAGQVLWTQTMRAGQNARAPGLAVAADGSCVVGGFFVGTLTVAGQPPATSSQPGNFNAPDGFVARFDPSGTCQWLRTMATSTGAARVSGVTLDPAGNPLVSGGCGGTTTFGPGVLRLGNTYDGFLAKYNTQGAVQWVQRFGGPEIDDASAVAVGANGAIFVCGSFGSVAGSAPTSTATFGPYTLTTIGSQGDPDGYLAKLDAQGNFQWVQAVQGIEAEFLCGVAVNQRGEVYLSGAAYGGELFGGTTPLPAATFGFQGFLAKYGATGTLRWLQGYGGDGSYFGASNRFAGLGVATDGVGRVYVCGAFEGNTTFGTIAVSGPSQYVSYPYLAALDDLEILATTPGSAGALATLAAYPNPSTGAVQLEWPATVRPTRLLVLDALGRTVRTLPMSSAQTSTALRLDNLPKGMYMLRLFSTGTTLTQKITLE